MKNNISWKALLLIGVIAIVVSRVFEGVVANAIGVLGDIVFLIGLVSMISSMIKARKDKKEPLSK